MMFSSIVSYSDILIFSFNLIYSLLPVFQNINYSYFVTTNYSNFYDSIDNTPSSIIYTISANGNGNSFEWKSQLMPISFVLNAIAYISYFTLYLTLYLNGSIGIHQYLPSYLISCLFSLFLFAQNLYMIKSFFQILRNMGVIVTPQQSPANISHTITPKFIYSYNSPTYFRNDSDTTNLTRNIVTSPISNSHFVFNCEYPDHLHQLSASTTTRKSSNLLTSPLISIHENVPPILATLLALSPIPSVNGLPIDQTLIPTDQGLGTLQQYNKYYHFAVVAVIILLITSKLLTLMSLILDKVTISVSVKTPLIIESCVLFMALIISHFAGPTINFILLPFPKSPDLVSTLLVGFIIVIDLCLIVHLNYSMDSFDTAPQKPDNVNDYNVYYQRHSEMIENMGFQTSETSRLLNSS